MNQIADRSGAWPSSVQDPPGSAWRMFRKYGVDYDQFERHSGVGGLWTSTIPARPCTSRRTSSRPGICPASTTIRCRRRSPTTRPAGRSLLHQAVRRRLRPPRRDPPRKRCHPHRCRRRQVAGDHLRRHHRTLSRVVCIRHQLASANAGAPGPLRRRDPARRDLPERSASSTASARARRRLGNSAADIGCDAAQSADAAFISTRRGYVIPEAPFGVLADQLDDGPWHVRCIERPLMTALLRQLARSVTSHGGTAEPITSCSSRAHS